MTGVQTCALPIYHRRPDIAYFSKGQIHAAATGANQSALFVIEIISNNDVMNRAYGKMKDYEAAGVEVVWLVFPLLKEVHVWNGRHSTVFRGDEICSAAPVLPNFQMVVADIFKLNV